MVCSCGLVERLAKMQTQKYKSIRSIQRLAFIKEGGNTRTHRVEVDHERTFGVYRR
jgi:hypothetical protein